MRADPLACLKAHARITHSMRPRTRVRGAGLGRTQKLVRQLRPCTSSTRRNIFRYESLSFCAAQASPVSVAPHKYRRSKRVHAAGCYSVPCRAAHQVRVSTGRSETYPQSALVLSTFSFLLLQVWRTFCRSASDTSNTRPFSPSDAICDPHHQARSAPTSYDTAEVQREHRAVNTVCHTRSVPLCPACA